MTVSVTVGPEVVVELVLLDTTPLESTPTIVNVYVFAGVTPFGVVVELVLFPHPGTRMIDPQSITSASIAHAFPARLRPKAAPTRVNPKIGSKSQNAKILRVREFAPVVTGPNVLIVSVELAGVPLIGSAVFPGGYENEHTGAMVTSGLMEEQASVTPPVGAAYPLIGLTVTTPCAPFPAGTLLGATVVVTVIVNPGETESTVRGSGELLREEVELVPVIVTV